MRKPYKLIVFDWDGTLMDSVAKIGNCLRAAAADCGLPDPGAAAARDIIGLGLREAFVALFPQADIHALNGLIARYRQHYLYDDRTEMTLFTGVPAGLEALRAHGYRLAIATGKARGGLDHVLQLTHVGKYFCATRCADEARSKPHPQMLHDLLRMTETAPTETLMVGDTCYDMEMAYNAGVARLGVTYGAHPRLRLLPHAPLACVDDFGELCQWLA